MKESTIKLLSELTSEFDMSTYNDRLTKVVEYVNDFKHYNKILTCGNGGSSADSSHIVGELMKSFVQSREIDTEFKNNYSNMYGADDVLSSLQGTVRAVSLCDNHALISAVSNDIGGDYIFSQQTYGLVDVGDVFIGISTSGNSKNVVNAIKVAKTKGAKIIGFTGMSGGIMSTLCDVLFNVDEKETFKVQQKHEILYHILCLVIENEEFSK